jgi:hypothetical protein
MVSGFNMDLVGANWMPWAIEMIVHGLLGFTEQQLCRCHCNITISLQASQMFVPAYA